MKSWNPHRHYWHKARRLLKLNAAQAAADPTMPFFADWQAWRSDVEWQASGGTMGFLRNLYAGHESVFERIASRASALITERFSAGQLAVNGEWGARVKHDGKCPVCFVWYAHAYRCPREPTVQPVSVSPQCTDPRCLLQNSCSCSKTKVYPSQLLARWAYEWPKTKT